jgi:hypothetical protein
MCLNDNLVKYLLSLLAVLSFVSLGYAGEPQFRIDSYIPQKFVDFQWKIDGFVAIEGERLEAVDERTEYGIRTEYVKTRDEQAFQIESNINYYRETKTDFLLWALRGNYYLVNSSPSGSGSHSDLSEPGLHFSGEGGTFVISDFFVSSAIDLSWVYIHNLHDINPDRHQREYDLCVAIMPGWGRIHDGRFAATAMYIVNELKNNGLLSRPPDNAEMLELTDKIYTFRTEYRVDERLHKIESLKAIIEYLESQGIVETTGPYGYLLIQDVWDYFPKESRRFGFRASAGFGFRYLYITDQMTDKRESDGQVDFHQYSHATRTFESPYIDTRIEFFKPIGMRWQLSLESHWKYYVRQKDRREYFRVAYQPNIGSTMGKYIFRHDSYYNFLATGSLRYILDSRTSAIVTAEYELNHYYRWRDHYRLSPDEEYNHRENITKLETSYLRLWGEIKYRISIPTTLRVRITMFRNNEQDNDLERNRYLEYSKFAYHLSASLVHYIFRYYYCCHRRLP